MPEAGRPHGRLAGVVGLDVDQRDGNAELGYWTAPTGRGRGLTTAGACAACAHGFSRLGLARVHLMAAVENIASNRVAERIGCTRTGVARAAILLRGPDGREVGRADATTWDLLPGEVARPARP